MIAYKIKTELEELAGQQKFRDVLIIGEGRSCESILKGIALQLKNFGFKNVDFRGDPGLLNFHQPAVEAYKLLNTDQESLLAWRILGNPESEEEKKKHLKNSKTLRTIIKGTPKALKGIKDEAVKRLAQEIESNPASDEEVRKKLLFQQIKRGNIHLGRPLCNLDITVCNILNSKGLGADIVWLVGFDQGRFPTGKSPTDSEVYQMLVAITRAKKRLHLVSTVGKQVSMFADCLSVDELEVEKIT